MASFSSTIAAPKTMPVVYDKGSVIVGLLVYFPQLFELGLIMPAVVAQAKYVRMLLIAPYERFAITWFFGVCLSVFCFSSDAFAIEAIQESAEADANDASEAIGGASESAEHPIADWRYLLNEKLDGWEVYTGVPHKTVKISGFPPSESVDCRSGKAFGLGDPKKVYQVKLIDEQPVLRVSGEVYAGLTSKEEFENYHFSTEFKWGEKKWPPRLQQKRDSGILVHCTGKHGAFWNVWMRCLECQIQEGDCGDLIQLAGTSCQLRATPESADREFLVHSPDGQWCTIGPGVRRWGAKHFGDHEIADGWNKVEVFTVGDRIVFSINGHPVMHLRDTRVGEFDKGVPLTKGKIQIQSEAAEVWYRDMKIRPIDQIPLQFTGPFEN